MKYSPALLELMECVIASGTMDEDSLWASVYYEANPQKLLAGLYHHVLPQVPLKPLYTVVRAYQSAFMELRYSTLTNFKCYTEVDFTLCPILNKKVRTKAFEVHPEVIAGLDAIYRRYVGTESNDASIHGPLVVILELTQHLQWAGFPVTYTFDQKWQDLKKNLYNFNSITVIDRLLTGRGNRVLEELVDFMPVEQKKQLFFDAASHYLTMDLAPYGLGSITSLCEAITEDKTLEPDFDRQLPDPFDRVCFFLRELQPYSPHWTPHGCATSMMTLTDDGPVTLQEIAQHFEKWSDPQKAQDGIRMYEDILRKAHLLKD